MRCRLHGGTGNDDDVVLLCREAAAGAKSPQPRVYASRMPNPGNGEGDCVNDPQRDEMSRKEQSESGGPAKRERSTRLSVNINKETADTLREITGRRGISYTEAIRRAVAIYKLIEEETQKGNRIQIDDGRRTKEILLLG